MHPNQALCAEWRLDYCAHSYLLFLSFACVCVMAKDGEVAFSFQPFWGQVSIVWVIIETKWPTR